MTTPWTAHWQHAPDVPREYLLAARLRGSAFLTADVISTRPGDRCTRAVCRVDGVRDEFDFFFDDPAPPWLVTGAKMMYAPSSEPRPPREIRARSLVRTR